MNSYPLGLPVRCACSFTAAGILTDPSTVQAKIRAPDGTITTYRYLTDTELVRDSTGVFHVDVVTTLGGTWAYRFISTGTAEAANEAEFFVQFSDFGVNG